MQENNPREKILKSIRKALIHKTQARFPALDWEKNIFSTDATSMEEQFITAFTKTGGRFVFCESGLDFLENLVKIAQENHWKKIYCTEPEITRLLDKVGFPYSTDEKDYAEGMTAITGCEALVSRLGSILVSSKQGSGRRLFVVPTSHVVVAGTSQLVPGLKDALQKIKDKYGEQLPSLIASLSGPSRTADIEKTLVTPAHGPKDLYVFLVDDPGLNNP